MARPNPNPGHPERQKWAETALVLAVVGENLKDVAGEIDMQRKKLTNSELRRKVKAMRDLNGFILGTLAQLYTGKIEIAEIRENIADDVALTYPGMDEFVSNFDFLVDCIQRGEEGMQDLRKAVVQEQMTDMGLQQPRQ